ncbi:FtsW/RodA/SpoVE family cell cycle protein [Bacillus sp. AK031]
MENRNYKNIDLDLLFLIMIFMIISCASIYSAQKYLPYGNDFAMKQGIWFLAGLVLTSIVYLFDFEQLQKLSPYLYILGVLSLFVLMISPSSIAPVIKGTKAWFSVPGFSLQPSEFMKVFLILFLASVISRHNEQREIRTFSSDFLLILKTFGITLIPLALILVQPDAGTGMVVMCIAAGMLFISGINRKLVALLIVLALLMLSSLVYIYMYKPDLLLLFLDDYQMNRIHSWLDPFAFSQGIGYQLTQSILATGSGTLFGKGFNEGQVIVPEAHSDFIFTVIGEEFGFVGASIVLGLYFLLIFKIVAIALRNKGEFESLIVSGVVAMLTFHIFENVGMVIGLVPITGIPLPLLSYGGSSVLGTLLALSLVNNISAKTKEYMFSSLDD